MGQCFGSLTALFSQSQDLQSRQGKAAREASKANVVAHDTRKVWESLSQQKQQGCGTGRIDIVLDNAGFEFLADLVLVGYLLESGLAIKVVLHGKRMPWFVSDVPAAPVLWVSKHNFFITLVATVSSDLHEGFNVLLI